MKRILQVAKQAAHDVGEDKVFTYSAALAFYTSLSLPPLLVILAWALGGVSPGAESHLEREAASLVGEEGAVLVNSILSNADDRVALGRGVSGWIGLGALLFAASGVFTQLQMALNRIWEVRAKPGAGWKTWLRKRFLSLGIVGVLAFLIAVSLTATTVMSALGLGPGEDLAARVLHGTISIMVFTLLFAAVFKLLPDVRMAWRDVFGGAVVTAILFSVSKHAIGFYLAKKGIGTTYGAAGSAVVVLAWVYFSGVVVFIGAEITQAWLKTSGRALAPNKHAEAIGPGRDTAPPVQGVGER